MYISNNYHAQIPTSQITFLINTKSLTLAGSAGSVRIDMYKLCVVLTKFKQNYQRLIEVAEAANSARERLSRPTRTIPKDC